MPAHTKYEKVYRKKRDILFNNFLGGMSWAVGATIGLALVIILLGFVSKNVKVVPIAGSFLSDLVNELKVAAPQLRQ